MPSPREHAETSVRLFGKPWLEVHEWLDAYHWVPGYGGVAHRRKRHHMAGCWQVRAAFGEQAMGVAMVHIIQDLLQTGWTLADRFPQDEADCERMGLWQTK